ncbi:hypothetical protein C3747_22g116 [Trypanosoma cruzi]|uniref:Uncharacterized protein n=2 Tax=Trypanosoma cruzi TaxID=5693 RepID=Q4CRA3_TRYCC|nr:hypothetical protein, conserved [Trypanosoma cruzi]EAN82804.1 hypothetical protein, conserved [Trypanosoma cruzi]KAF5219536.1 hypothetical protein ECC02_007477 [Trypanosoma cruzi]PWV16704.1 hypothetical protein C3747_22g116 [Trypanosoma cruzi]RNC58155.1 hypothetical protein TcCL_ESM04202 [Trypanosoma cruzi]|eukprot:XP_804655.1 hypothetical protein [Trypanosoma cruzi strain CL Brener]
MSASIESKMSFWVHPNNHDAETYKLYINRLVFIDTAEDSRRWLARAKKQWGFDQPIAIRVMNESEHLGTTTPQMIGSHAGWTGISWTGDANDGVGIDVPNHQGPMLVLEVVGGKSTLSIYGTGLINSSGMATEKRQYAKYCVHLFPTQTTFDSETVFAVVEAEIRSCAWDGRHGDEFAPLEYNFGSVRVSTLDFYFPSFMLTGTGEYIVSNLVCAMNMTENSALAMQLVPLMDARDYISVEPAQVITVKPQQRVYFTATWSIAERACMKELQVQLVVNGSQPPSAPINISVHNCPPQLKSTDTPYHYWLNTTCVTNRQFSLSQEFSLVFALLPVFRFVLNGRVAGLGAEGVIVALDKDKGENVLVRADGVPVVNVLSAGLSTSLFDSSFENNAWAQAEKKAWSMPDDGKQFALDTLSMNLLEKTCQCTIHLGTIRGFPMVYEVSTGISPSFQVSITLLDQKGWQVVKGETKARYQSASGSLRWDDQLVLRKWPGASSKQFARLNLTEVRPRDGDETPIGAALVSLYRLDRTRLHVGIQLAFHVYETYSLYDTLHSSSLLMTDAFITFSELPF